MKNKVAIIGAGAWGTAIGKAIALKGHSVELWSFEKDVAEDINTNHINSKYLPHAGLPDNVTATTDLIACATDKEFIILASPSLFLLDTIKKLLSVPNIMEGQSVIGILTKGFIPTNDEPKLIVEMVENFLPGFYKGNVVYISGPSHAEEVVQGKLTGLISACPNPKNSIRFRELLNSNALRVFSSLDVVGVQVSAAIKNVIAIAFGIMDALKENNSDFFGDNTESLLLAAGLNEIQILGQALGATHPETFTSIAGVGDLDVTCRSQFGRNRRFGREIVLKNILKDYKDIDDLIANIQKIGYLPEGIVAAKYAFQLKQKYKLRLNIISLVFTVLNKEANPEEALKTLL